jgi:hypothetical protein
MDLSDQLNLGVERSLTRQIGGAKECMAVKGKRKADSSKTSMKSLDMVLPHPSIWSHARA